MDSTPGDSEDLPPTCAPPCIAHETTPAHSGQVLADPQQTPEVYRWRKAERVRLVADRESLAGAVRRTAAQAIEIHLDRYLAAQVGDVAGLTVSAWWPIKAEIDLRPWLSRVAARGVRLALPVVLNRAEPMKFRHWSKGARMAPGIWNIPVPVDTPECIPDIYLVPLVGWDMAGYRLGYGGGYFDRTLAALSPGPLAIGIGLHDAQLATIFPQSHDVSMAAIITETGLEWCKQQNRGQHEHKSKP